MGESSKVQKPITETFVIGDVHGCVAELTELLALICEKAKAPKIEVILLGDSIDKGPDSAGVLDLVFMSSFPNLTIRSILGNHCEKFLRWCFAQQREEAGGAKNEIKNKWGFEKIREYQDFLVQCPLWISLPEYGVTLLHGGVETWMKELPSAKLSEASKYEKNILRIRYLSSTGKMIRLGEEDLEKGDRWWADVYDGRFGTIIYGHQPYDKVAYHEHAIGLDTSCVHGGELTALHLSVDGKHQILSVKAREKYCKAYDEE